ncbi:hypothetical protein ACJMK2_032920 [Sinanodonta woodiana]|uniref:Uncharacterized protein n=1 Tax=Sinanodonta woodiana TaxID=1069815 RepID=A0ABD3X3F8_SINWO
MEFRGVAMHSIRVLMFANLKTHIATFQICADPFSFNVEDPPPPIDYTAGDMVDNKFDASLKRHFDDNGTGNKSVFPVAWTYNKHSVNATISCWRKDSHFDPNPEVNREIVRNYPIGASCSYLAELGLMKPYTNMKIADFPVFITGASSNHYLESQAMLHNFHEKVMTVRPDVKLIYYNLGLSIEERSKVKKYCRCEVRDFPFDKYPDHVAFLPGFAWKIIIIQTVLNEYGYVLWLDTSMRFQNMSLFPVLEAQVAHYGISTWMFGYSLGGHVDPDTFKFLGEDPCLFYDKKDAAGGGIIVRRTQFTLETIMRPWVSCALSFGCMVTSRSNELFHCPAAVGPAPLGSCHRFDQAILGIILYRVYGRDDILMFPVGLVKPIKQSEEYFLFLENKGQK